MILPIKIKSFSDHFINQIIFCVFVFFAIQTKALASNILILGDSLSAGYGINENKGWVSLLQLQRPDLNIINGSVSGETSAGGLRRLPNLLANSAPDLVVVELGGNDGLRGFAPQELKKKLQKIIETSLNFGSDVLLTEIQVPPNYGPRYSKAFNQVYYDLAESNDITLIPFFMVKIAPDLSLMQADGIHPNEKAQPLITEWMRPWIENAIENN